MTMYVQYIYECTFGMCADFHSIATIDTKINKKKLKLKRKRFVIDSNWMDFRL